MQSSVFKACDTCFGNSVMDDKSQGGLKLLLYMGISMARDGLQCDTEPSEFTVFQMLKKQSAGSLRGARFA
jgi:hypothetical protein